MQVPVESTCTLHVPNTRGEHLNLFVSAGEPLELPLHNPCDLQGPTDSHMHSFMQRPVILSDAMLVHDGRHKSLFLPSQA